MQRGCWGTLPLLHLCNDQLQFHYILNKIWFVENWVFPPSIKCWHTAYCHIQTLFPSLFWLWRKCNVKMTLPNASTQFLINSDQLKEKNMLFWDFNIYVEFEWICCGRKWCHNYQALWKVQLLAATKTLQLQTYKKETTWLLYLIFVTNIEYFIVDDGMYDMNKE